MGGKTVHIGVALEKYLENPNNAITAEIMKIVVDYFENLEERVKVLEEKVKEQGHNRKWRD